jgi:long-chain acyl-CoA synthetase
MKTTIQTPTICHKILELPTRGTESTAILKKEFGNWKKIGWLEYYDKILCTSSALLAIGVKPGSKVAIMSNTRFEWSVFDHAILAIHAITVPIYPSVTTEELEFILQNSESEVLVLEGRSQLKLFLQIRDKCPQVKKVIVFDQVRDSDLDFFSWDDFFILGKQEKPTFAKKIEQLCKSTTADQMATLIYTSGTTGQPKGVVLNHEQIISEVTEAFANFGVTAEDRSLSFLPYAHVLGRIEHWGHLYVGYQIAYAESIEKIKYNLVEVQPTFIMAVPRIFEKIYGTVHAKLSSNSWQQNIFARALSIGTSVSQMKQEKKQIPLSLFLEHKLAQKLALNKITEVFGGKLRFAISGGAPLSQQISGFFHACGILILEGYGLTETTGAICVNTPFNFKFGTVGTPIGDVKLTIAEDGEILVQSKKLMQGYYKDLQTTKIAMTDGWFHTGDIGEILPSGHLKITDRKKDLIKTAGGKYVAPQKLENLLKKYAFISNVLIHGDQKKYIVALITLDQAAILNMAYELQISYQDPASLTQHPQILNKVRQALAEVNATLASYETIKRFSVLTKDFTVEQGELTPSLKIRRKFLDQKYAEQIDSLYQ